MRFWLWLEVICFLGLFSFVSYKEIKKIPIKREKRELEIKRKRYFEEKFLIT
jgi:hypothetical protein